MSASTSHTHVVSFSGGRTSAYLVHLMDQQRRHHGWNVRYVFMDTGAEHPNTYRFIKRLVEQWDIPLTVLRVKINPVLGIGNGYQLYSAADLLTERMPPLQPFMDIAAKYGTPTIYGPFCTARMKTRPHRRYCEEMFGKGNYTTWLGIRADEPRRLRPKEGVRYLAELDDTDKRGILDWWRQQPFDLELPEHLGNCVFCIKKSIPKLALASRDEPELARQFIDQVINNPRTRTVDRAVSTDTMYRGYLSLEKIILLHADQDQEQLTQRVYRGRVSDDGGCSESCEILTDDNQEPTDD